jgi:hypothetical protein
MRGENASARGLSAQGQAGRSRALSYLVGPAIIPLLSLGCDVIRRTSLLSFAVADLAGMNGGCILVAVGV